MELKIAYVEPNTDTAVKGVKFTRGVAGQAALGHYYPAHQPRLRRPAA